MAFIGSLRGLGQASGALNGNEAIFQGSESVATTTAVGPYGLNKYYSFGGASQEQSIYYKVVATTGGGGNYTATFSSALVTPTDINPTTTINPGTLTFSALTNAGGTSGTASTDTSIVVLDSNYNVYVDNVSGSPTNGYRASDNTPSAGANGFRLQRQLPAGVFYIVVGIGNVATNQLAAQDDLARNNAVLDFDNVIATNNQFYNDSTGVKRPTDFSITNSAGNTVYTSSNQAISSLYGLNVYKLTVGTSVTAAMPEPGSIALLAAGTPFVFLLRNKQRRKRN